MTKQFLLIILLCQGSIVGLSQPFHGGVIVGICASQVDGDSYSGYNKPGLQGGVFISAALAQHIDARMEIKYSGRGARNPASDDNTGTYALSLHYIDLPFIVVIRVKQVVFVEAGLVPGYLFARQGKDDAGKMPDEYLLDFHKFDLGILLGAGICLSPKIMANIRYSYSVLSIRDLESAGAYYSWFGKLFGHSRGDFNNYLTLGISYRIK